MTENLICINETNLMYAYKREKTLSNLFWMHEKYKVSIYSEGVAFNLFNSLPMIRNQPQK